MTKYRIIKWQRWYTPQYKWLFWWFSFDSISAGAYSFETEDAALAFIKREAIKERVIWEGEM